MMKNISRKSNLICEVAAILLSLTAITMITYNTVKYIELKKYETQLVIKLAGADIMSLYNVVGHRQIDSIKNDKNKKISVTYTNATREDINQYKNKLIAEKYKLSKSNKDILEKTSVDSSEEYIIHIGSIDGLYAITYFVR